MRRSIGLRRWGGRGEMPLNPVYPEPAEPRRTPGKKDTKRWCRGKVGVEHQLAWVLWEQEWYDERCTECGKKFRYCTPWLSKSSRWQPEGCVCGHHK